jgi:hypothetical protein
MRTEGTACLIWLYDIVLLGRQMDGAQWLEFSHIAAQKGIAGICREALDLVSERFPLSVPQGCRVRLQEAEPHEVFRPDRVKTALSYQLYDLLALESWSDRLRWIGESLFPSPDYMLSKYQRRSYVWLPLLYLLRFAGGVGKRLGSRDRRREL